MNDYASLSRLNWLQQVPRALTPEIETQLEQIHGKPAFFVFWGGGRKGWERKMTEARLSFVYVVQANSCLYSAASATWAPAVLLAFSDPRGADPEWVARNGAGLCQRVSEGRHAELGTLAALLQVEGSEFDLQLKAEVTEAGAPCRVWTTVMDPSLLPAGAIPESRVLPALNHGSEWSIIPPKLYA